MKETEEMTVAAVWTLVVSWELDLARATSSSEIFMVHFEGSPVQMKSDSISPFDEQPSPSIVFLSSHISSSTMIPSPKTGLQLDPSCE